MNTKIIYCRSINNKLQQTFNFYTWEWGVQVIVENSIEGQKNVKFDERRFRICKTYPTIEHNINRAMRHWHLTDDNLVK